MSKTIVSVGYKSVFTGLWNELRYYCDWDENQSFEEYLADIFLVCNSDPEDHGFEVIEDNIQTSLSVGDSVNVDIIGFPPTGRAICRPNGWEILVDPVKITAEHLTA